MMDPVKVKYSRRFKKEKAILMTLGEQPLHAFSFETLVQLIENNRASWELAPTTPAKKTIERFLRNNILTQQEIFFSEEEKYLRYTYEDPSPLEIAVSLHPKAYLSHYSAAALLNLTTQVPKTIYTTVEESMRIGPTGGDLNQKAIDHAFSQPQRRPAYKKARIGDYEIQLLTSKYTDRAGVLAAARIPHTGIERTLIDLAVRPAYSGGAFLVLDMYRQAVVQGISATKIVNWLDKFRYIYPYHQSIGFLLEKAGYAGKALAALKELPMEFDFYLDYGMQEKEYSKTWRLYYPKGM